MAGMFMSGASGTLASSFASGGGMPMRGNLGAPGNGVERDGGVVASFDGLVAVSRSDSTVAPVASIVMA
jgi:hypothetical protein